jgi:RNA polymerase sigma-70 factor (ECF subfamily)
MLDAMLEDAKDVLERALGPYATPRVRERWQEHVASVVGPDGLSALALEDLALALAAALGEPNAVAEIERTIIEPLPRTLSRLRPKPELVDELRQELREKLLVGPSDGRPKLLEYKGRGPLGAWARVIALRAAYDQARASQPESKKESDDALDGLIAAGDDPELAELRRRYSAELRDAFRAAARRLDAEERAVLRSQAIDGLTIDQIGALYQVHRATAARWVQQAKASLLSALREELAKRLGEGHDACDSVVALVRSRIDLSLERAFE